ncbi:cell division protein FtsL [Peribacillus asahii]|uniref:cell division protein FtsL n=1 Tax=Peribacillus asahii TaxID=228899 RepID=UPI00207B0014|nr:cell division protein FtsL [Peribacillus asahii]USK61117.1 cell division protein FtsL [Peribacillus asahii]
MNSFAKKIQEQQPEQQRQTVQTVVVRKSKISIGELFLLCALAVMVAFVSVKMISNQAAIYKVNKDIQQAEISIEKQTKANEDLKIQVKELSGYERLWKKAEELGLKRNDNNVKVVQE